MIAVVDYCKGNLKSVERGLRAVGGDAHITDNPEVIRAADAVVLPGVGSFADASQHMVESGQLEAVRDAIAAGKPFLGICLGEHLLFETGVEGAAGPGVDGAAEDPSLPVGLGVVSGTVVRMPSRDAQGVLCKVPHVGWNSVEFTAECPLFEGIASGEYFYFTHSYIAPENECTVATTTHSVTFPCAVQKGKVFGVQFHPEKSSHALQAAVRSVLHKIAQAKAKGLR